VASIYISTVSLAKLRPDASLGDAASVLKLSDGGSQYASSGFTEWDQAFLTSVYATDQRSRLQRHQIARRMVRELAH
jgi:hypothetical protein